LKRREKTKDRRDDNEDKDNKNTEDKDMVEDPGFPEKLSGLAMSSEIGSPHYRGDVRGYRIRFQNLKRVLIP
jgi:hypothetical protein